MPTKGDFARVSRVQSSTSSAALLQPGLRGPQGVATPRWARVHTLGERIAGGWR